MCGARLTWKTGERGPGAGCQWGRFLGFLVLSFTSCTGGCCVCSVMCAVIPEQNTNRCGHGHGAPVSRCLGLRPTPVRCTLRTAGRSPLGGALLSLVPGLLAGLVLGPLNPRSPRSPGWCLVSPSWSSLLPAGPGCPVVSMVGKVLAPGPAQWSLVSCLKPRWPLQLEPQGGGGGRQQDEQMHGP